MKTQRTDAEWNEMTAEQKRAWAEEVHHPSAQPPRPWGEELKTMLVILCLVWALVVGYYGVTLAVGTNPRGEVVVVSALPLWGALFAIVGSWLGAFTLLRVLRYVSR